MITMFDVSGLEFPQRAADTGMAVDEWATRYCRVRFNLYQTHFVGSELAGTVRSLHTWDSIYYGISFMRHLVQAVRYMIRQCKTQMMITHYSILGLIPTRYYSLPVNPLRTYLVSVCLYLSDRH